MSRSPLKFLISLLFLMAVSSVAGGRDPRFHSKECDTPLGAHSPPSSRSRITAPKPPGWNAISYKKFLSQFRKHLDEAALVRGNEKVRPEISQLSGSLRRYSRNVVELSEVIYPTRESLLGMESLISTKILGIVKQMKDPQSRAQIKNDQAELERRALQVFRPNLVKRALRDWATMAAAAKPRALARELSQVLEQLIAEVSKRFDSPQKTSQAQLTSIGLLFDKAMIFSKDLEWDPRALTPEIDFEEAHERILPEIARYEDLLRTGIEQLRTTQMLDMIRHHREENRRFLGGPIEIDRMQFDLLKLTYRLLSFGYVNDSSQ